MNWELVGIFGYIAFQFVIGAVLVRKIRNEEDYFLAGRSFGMTLATFSVFATWFGAETCLGSSGAIYSEGLAGSRSDPFGYTICLVLAGLILAAPLWKGGYITLADLFRQRFGNKVERAAAILMIPTSLIWAAAQIRAFGQVIAASSDMSAATAMGIAAFVVIAYTVVGGLRADVITDFVQGIAIIIGLGLLLIVTVMHLGGISATIEMITPERLSFTSTEDRSIWTQLNAWMIPIMGSLVSQELASRVMSSRSPAIARNSSLIAALMYLLVGSLPLVIGLIGPQLVPGLEDPEQLLPTIARQHLHTFLYILFAGALVSAMLSTVDSALLAVGSLASHNVISPLTRITSEMGKVRLARFCVAIAGGIAFFVAISSESILSLVEFASSLGGSGVLVITLFGLFTRFGGQWAALAALIGGVVMLIAGEQLWQLDAPFLSSVLAAFVSFVLVGLIVKK